MKIEKVEVTRKQTNTLFIRKDEKNNKKNALKSKLTISIFFLKKSLLFILFTQTWTVCLKNIDPIDNLYFFNLNITKIEFYVSTQGDFLKKLLN